MMTGPSSVERFQVSSPFIQTNVFNLSGSTNSLQDTDVYVNLWGPNSPLSNTYYQIQAHYASGDSAWSPPVYLQANAPATVSLITGPQQSPYLAVASLPAGTTALGIYRVSIDNESFDLTNVIEVASSTNGFYPVPATVMATPADGNGNSYYNSALVTRRAKPTCRRLRPVRIAAATLSASSPRPPPWTIHDSFDVLKPTMAGHSPELTLHSLNLLFS
jgi:hypothetical protein